MEDVLFRDSYHAAFVPSSLGLSQRVGDTPSLCVAYPTVELVCFSGIEHSTFLLCFGWSLLGYWLWSFYSLTVRLTLLV